MQRNTFSSILVFLLVIVFGSGALAGESSEVSADQGKVAIVLAGFGTTEPSAVEAITNIQDKVKEAFPGIPVKITFTSNIIRSVWKERRADAEKWLKQGIPGEILYVKNIIATIGDLREDNYRNIIVQPTHMFYMEQAQDLSSYVNALASIKTTKERWMPFDRIVIGRPALGGPGNKYDYHDDMEKALKTLEADVKLAKSKKAKLVYMGHGNDHWSTGIYMEAARKMCELYPDVVTYIGAVEGFPGIEDVAQYLSHHGSGNVVLKPFMIVAGDHAINDMASDDAESWKSILTKQGCKVTTVLKGLGSNDKFAQIFVDHIKDAARDSRIEL
ncbi:MAG: sirohydrochlorin cobaltochelatase [Desulfatiglans sp.]|jgi:sirohydrochlorin cobaltochelatase|nr:sirohydrochlorin cobaltochelatase [Thermodesulfobacteriota bacterium]MEE4353010.1 sirohydrochlorin cobaltochelatase [Desulfatiglans sp.]